MAIEIQNVTASQGTGAQVKESVVEVLVDFSNTNGNTCNLAAWLSVDGGGTWHAATLHGNANGQNLAAGTDRLILIKVRDTIDNNALADYNGANAKVRVQVTDRVTSEQSSLTELDPHFPISAAFALQTFQPTFTSTPTMADFVKPAAAVTVVATKYDTTSPTYIRVNTDAAAIATAPSTVPAAFTSPYNYNFPSAIPTGEVTVYVRVYDEFYNASETVTVGAASDPANQLPWLQREAPTNPTVRITGTVGHGDYTGIRINADGSFTPDREVTLQLAATSPIEVTYRIRDISDIEEVYTVDAVAHNVSNNDQIVLDANTAQALVSLTTNRASPAGDDYDTDATVIVSVDFTDAAGNVSQTSASIRLNTRIYKTANKPMREQSPEYQPILREVTTQGNEVVIPKTMLLADEPIRAWADTFYPASHSYPVTPAGDFDEAAAIAMNGNSNSSNDAVLLDNGVVVTDDDGRPVTADWTNDGSKDYSHLLSASVSDLVHWVIDNSGYGDFQLEFEFFDLDSLVFGPPFNPLAPYKGDVLVVYDASENGALQETYDAFGRPTLELVDSSKLKELWAFTGSGTNVMNLTTGARMNSGPNGNFKTDWIRGISKIVLILYTDASSAASGFKLKSGSAQDKLWINYHVDEGNGEIWVHKHESLGTASGAADTTAKRMIYDYLDGYVDIDYDTGKVLFDADPAGTVYADYAYYDGAALASDLLLASHDDFVDYQSAPVYVTGAGKSVEDTDTLLVWENDNEGRIVEGTVWDKDRGVVQINLDLAQFSGRRLFADYYHHTYKRLADDGYGDLTFEDSVIVADDTPAYPDYTWGDVKIVNEGDAALEDGKFVFTARGYDTNNDGKVILDPADSGGNTIVDQVLNVNRPWDVQKGTKDETYDKMAMAVADSFIWDRSCPKSGGNGTTGNSGATAILSYWKNRSFGDLDARARKFGRVVWVLGGTGGSSYPATTAGEKRCSLEVSGKYYTQTIL